MNMSTLYHIWCTIALYCSHKFSIGRHRQVNIQPGMYNYVMEQCIENKLPITVNTTWNPTDSGNWPVYTSKPNSHFSALIKGLAWVSLDNLVLLVRTKNRRSPMSFDGITWLNIVEIQIPQEHWSSSTLNHGKATDHWINITGTSWGANYSRIISLEVRTRLASSFGSTTLFRLQFCISISAR